MMASRGRPNREATPGDHPAWFFAAVGLLLLIVTAGLIAWLAAVLTGVGSGSLPGWLAGRDGRRWSTPTTWVAVLLTLLFALLVSPVVVALVRRWRGRSWTDPLASSMSTRKDLAELRESAVKKDTVRLGCSHTGTGVRLGRSVLGREWLYGTYEWSQVWVMGTRAGKTRSVAIPQIIEHHGPVVSTSNKVDVRGRTFGPRSEMGRCWTNDPQQITGQEPDWWWNPLTFVTNVERAEKLVAIWSAARTSEDTAGIDPYFEPEGRNLASTVLLAAAMSREPITRVPDWLTGRRPRPGVPDPTEILRDHGYVSMAREIDEYLGLDDGQRDGLFGTARSMFRWLRDPRYVAWVARIGADDNRPQFDPAAFVRSEADTLYLLSKEGPGSARAITGALIAATYTAAEEYAEQSGERVPTPVLFLLDEAANIVRWPELPALYSHAGGKGIILVAIVQSVPQAERAWGKGGFGEMWSAANVLCIGRGVNDADTLGALARMVGDRQVRDQSTSTGFQHRSVSRQNKDEHILSESDLRALPRGRAVLFTSGARPILLENVDYSQHDWAWKADGSWEAYGTRTGVSADA